MPDAKSPHTPARLKMADIARLADVSVSTVSRALAGNPLIPKESRDKIEAIARQHGYVVNHAARNLRMQITRTIGLVLPAAGDGGQHVTDPFLLEIIGHLSDEVVSRDHDLLLTRVSTPNEGWLHQLVQSHRFDGMIVLGQSDQHAALNEMADRYRPMVVWGEKLPDQRYCSVGADNVLGGRLATEHLIATGRRRIQFIGPVHVPEVASRYLGYRQALQAAGLDADIAPATSGFSDNSAYNAMRRLLAQKAEFDAVFAASDVIAHGAKRAFSDWGGQVPQDCALVGFDDVAMAKHLTPPLTTVRQDLRIAARAMLDLLFKRIAGEDARSEVIPASLIVRDSTAARV